MRTRFTNRGYYRKTIEKAYHRASQANRNELLNGKKKATTDNMVRFFTHYNTRWREVKGTLAKHWGILQTDGILTQYIGATPSITFKRAPKN